MNTPHQGLETERLRLREFDLVHAEQIASYYQRNAAHFRSSSPLRSSEFHSVSAWRARLQAVRTDVPASAVRFMIHYRTEPEMVVGHVELSEIVRGAFLSCYIGYGVDAAFAGQGVGTEAVRAVVGYAFHELGLHRVQANYMPANTRSARLLQRIGFKAEGLSRDYLFLGGAWHDHVISALLNPEPLTPAL